jgi:hypothetical protein
MRLIASLYSAAGVVQTPDTNGVYTLANNTTYYAEIFDGLAPPDAIFTKGWSVHWEHGASLTADITVEASNRPSNLVTPFASSGWAPTATPTISVAASAGEKMQHHADFMAARARAKIAVGPTGGGTLRGWEHGKEWGDR